MVFISSVPVNMSHIIVPSHTSLRIMASQITDNSTICSTACWEKLQGSINCQRCWPIARVIHLYHGVRIRTDPLRHVSSNSNKIPRSDSPHLFWRLQWCNLCLHHWLCDQIRNHKYNPVCHEICPSHVADKHTSQFVLKGLCVENLSTRTLVVIYVVCYFK